MGDSLGIREFFKKGMTAEAGVFVKCLAFCYEVNLVSEQIAKIPNFFLEFPIRLKPVIFGFQQQGVSATCTHVLVMTVARTGENVRMAGNKATDDVTDPCHGCTKDQLTTTAKSIGPRLFETIVVHVVTKQETAVSLQKLQDVKAFERKTSHAPPGRQLPCHSHGIFAPAKGDLWNEAGHLCQEYYLFG